MDLETAIILRDTALSAYQEALKAKSYKYSVGSSNREKESQDIDKLRAEYLQWQDQVDKLNGVTTKGLGYVLP